jgi:hypothetical protein
MHGHAPRATTLAHLVHGSSFNVEAGGVGVRWGIFPQIDQAALYKRGEGCLTHTRSKEQELTSLELEHYSKGA